MKNVFILPLLLLSTVTCTGTPGHLESLNLPADCQQVIEVTTKTDLAPTGQLQRFAKDRSGAWKAEGKAIPVSIGRSGLAWGRGLHLTPDKATPRKTEGDGKAPAGIFSLGTAFGYAPSAPPGCQMPYRQANENDYFVDSSKSPKYNQWVTHKGGIESARKKWGSVESMRRDDALYEFGIIVEHNTPAKEDAGSAIFIHVWSKPGNPTAGCTAMSRDHLIELLSWLDPKQNPVLVQGSQQMSAKLKHKQ